MKKSLAPILLLANGLGYSQSNKTLTTKDSNTIICSATLNVTSEYPGGVVKFTNDILSTIDLKNLEPGYEKQTLQVYADFIIQKDGTLTDLKITKDPGFGFGKEVERVIKLNRTKWLPGIKDSKPTTANFSLPITLEQEK